MPFAALLPSIEPMEWLTVGLVLFAGAQVLLQHRTELARSRERKEDRDQRLAGLVGITFAEGARLLLIADEWEEHGLQSLASMERLDPRDVLPTDRGQLHAVVGELGEEAAISVMAGLRKIDRAHRDALTICKWVGGAGGPPDPTLRQQILNKIDKDAQVATRMASDYFAHATRVANRRLSSVPFLTGGASLLEDPVRHETRVIPATGGEADALARSPSPGTQSGPG